MPTNGAQLTYRAFGEYGSRNMPSKQRDKQLAGKPYFDIPQDPGPLTFTRSKNCTPPKITYELIAKIGDKVAEGLPIELALMLEPEPIPLEHWKQALDKRPRMLRAFKQRLALFVQGAVREINSVTLRTLPGKVWTLERRFPEYFSTSRQVKHEHTGTLLVGLAENMRERATAYARERINEPAMLRSANAKRLKRAKVTDIQAVQVSADKPAS